MKNLYLDIDGVLLTKQGASAPHIDLETNPNQLLDIVNGKILVIPK